MVKGAVGNLILAVALHRDGEVHDTAVEGWRIKIGLLVHGSRGPFGLGIETSNSLAEGAVEFVGPAFGEVDVVGDSSRNPNIFNISVTIFGGAADRGVVLPCEDEHFASGRSEASGQFLSGGGQGESGRREGEKEEGVLHE